jgi:hypothetical protein
MFMRKEPDIQKGFDYGRSFIEHGHSMLELLDMVENHPTPTSDFWLGVHSYLNTRLRAMTGLS